MKKTYETLEMNVLILLDDLIRMSANDNVEDLPEFPEFFH